MVDLIDELNVAQLNKYVLAPMTEIDRRNVKSNFIRIGERNVRD